MEDDEGDLNSCIENYEGHIGVDFRTKGIHLKRGKGVKRRFQRIYFVKQSVVDI